MLRTAVVIGFTEVDFLALLSLGGVALLVGGLTRNMLRAL